MEQQPEQVGIELARVDWLWEHLGRQRQHSVPLFQVPTGSQGGYSQGVICLGHSPELEGPWHLRKRLTFQVDCISQLLPTVLNQLDHCLFHLPHTRYVIRCRCSDEFIAGRSQLPEAGNNLQEFCVRKVVKIRLITPGKHLILNCVLPCIVYGVTLETNRDAH